MSRRSILDRRSSSGDRACERNKEWRSEFGGRRWTGQGRLSLDIILPSSLPLPSEQPVNSDPWCLTCGEKVREVGEVGDRPCAVRLRRHGSNELCELFPRVLGVQVSDAYPSDCVCHKCERQLRRLGRYGNIILARNEASKIREQLEKNLANYGQAVIESGQSAEYSVVEDSDISGRHHQHIGGPSFDSFSQGVDCDGASGYSKQNPLDSVGTRKKRPPLAGSGVGIGGLEGGHFRRGRSYESPSLKGRKLLRSDLSYRSSSLGCIPSEAAIDESVERELELKEGSRSTSSQHIPHPLLSPVFDEGELRRQARPRKRSRDSAAEEESEAPCITISLLVPSFAVENHSETEERYFLKYEEDALRCYPVTPSDVGIALEGEHLVVEKNIDCQRDGSNSECSKTFTNQVSVDSINIHREDLLSQISCVQQDCTDTSTLTDTAKEYQSVAMASGEDKAKLVAARSESLDQSVSSSGRREKYKNRAKFFSLSFKSSEKSNKKSPSGIPVRSKQKNEAKSPERSEGVEATAEADKGKEDTGQDAGTPTHWSGRVNPFDKVKTPNGVDGETGETPVSPRSVLTDDSDLHASFDEDDMFGKGIVDLDEESSPAQHNPEASLDRTESMQADEELLQQIETANISQGDNMPPSGFSSRQASVDDAAVSAMEQHINLKSQFKGAFYNIGSTEDLLQEFANEEEARKLKLVTTPSVDLIELPPFMTSAGATNEGKEKNVDEDKKASGKGKLLKYESLDLDIDNSNPFFTDVYSEYHRRVAAKEKAKGSSAGKVTASANLPVDEDKNKLLRPAVILERENENDEPSSGDTTPIADGNRDKCARSKKSGRAESSDRDNDTDKDADKIKDGDAVTEKSTSLPGLDEVEGQSGKTTNASVFKTEVTVKLSPNIEGDESSQSSASYRSATSSPDSQIKSGQGSEGVGQGSSKREHEGDDVCNIFQCTGPFTAPRRHLLHALCTRFIA